MGQTQSIASAEGAKASSILRAVTPAIQKSPNHDGGHSSTSPQQAVNMITGGHPQTAPQQFGSALQAMSGSPSMQAGALRQLQRSYGNSYVGGVIQRKCECGGSCGGCGGGERKRIQRKGEGNVSSTSGAVPAIQRSGGGAPLDNGTRSFMESGFGTDFGGVRVHTDGGAAQASRELHAQAFTMGQDIYFASGRYQPQTQEGQKLIAHELTHVVQQDRGGVGGGQTKLTVGEAGDAYERQADAMAAQVVSGGAVSSDAMMSGATPAVQRQESTWDEFVGYLEGAVETVEGAVEDVEDTVVGAARELWNFAEGVAEALGGIVSFSEGRLIIDVPEMQVADAYDMQFSLPEIGADIPFAIGIIPIAEVVEIYGMLAVHVGITPELSGQFGPAYLHHTTIIIDPLAPSFYASGGLTVTTAFGVGGELRTGVHGEVGIIVIWPDPPLILEIPIAAIEGGLAGFARAIGSHTFTISGEMGYGGGTFGLTTDVSDIVGLAFDWGLAGYGSLEVLGLNLCTFYWPLFEDHWDTTVLLGGGLDLSIDSSGADLDITVDDPVLDPLPWDDLGIQIGRGMFADDCPLCAALYRLGLMPSQWGGRWKGHPKPEWPGPATGIYPRDPKIPSGSLCRGACGPNCDTCDPPEDEAEEKVVCEEDGDRHRWWFYPKYQICRSHQGCRDHDACYDWCAATFGEKGLIGLIFGPCHRACDFECICNYGAKQCVTWIGGGLPYDHLMQFSDEPYTVEGCKGPCPEETDESSTGYQMCLPDITLFGRKRLSKGTSIASRKYPLYTTVVEVPYIGPVVIHVFAQAKLSAEIGAALGPAFLRDVCLDADPHTGIYKGSAELHLKASVDGLVKLKGLVDASAKWLCLIEVIGLEGGLQATGTGEWENEIVDRVEIECVQGDTVLSNDLSLNSCLKLGFDLDAFLKVRLFTFTVLEEKWNLIKKRWKTCWDGIELTALATGGADPALIAPAIGVGALLAFLLTDTGDLETPQLPDDPAAASNSTNPCGDDEPDADCGSARLPLTHVTFNPGPQGQGGSIEAKPLTRCEGNTHGSQPDRSIFATQWACLVANNRNQYYVRAHLLHGETSTSGPRNLHGPGDDMRNLILTDKSLNTNMYNRAEKDALDRVHGPNEEVLWYRSVVDSYYPGRDFFGQSITVSYGSFDPVTNTEGPQLGGGTFPNRRVPPNCP